MIVRLKDAEGRPMLVNPDNVAMVVAVKAQNVDVIGKCMVVCVGGSAVVSHTIEEVYGLLRRPESSNGKVVNIAG